MKHFCYSLVVFLVFISRASSSTIVYSLAADWSDSSNPNGPWSYNKSPGQPLATNQPDWNPARNFSTSPLPAWADDVLGATSSSPAHVPVWFKSNGTLINDLPAGRVGMHGSEIANAGVSWTSQYDGLATITGGAWLMQYNHTRDMFWNILLNDVSITGGLLSHLDTHFTSASPFDFGAGSGGFGALSLMLSQGDVLTLEITKAPNPENNATFVGVDFVISQEVVPEPTSFAIWCGAIVLGGVVWRHRTRLV